MEPLLIAAFCVGVSMLGFVDMVRTGSLLVGVGAVVNLVLAAASLHAYLTH